MKTVLDIAWWFYKCFHKYLTVLTKLWEVTKMNLFLVLGHRNVCSKATYLYVCILLFKIHLIFINYISLRKGGFYNDNVISLGENGKRKFEHYSDHIWILFRTNAWHVLSLIENHWAANAALCHQYFSSWKWKIMENCSKSQSCRTTNQLIILLEKQYPVI